MTPISIGIGLVLFGLKMLTNKDVIRIAKQLVVNVDKRQIAGKEKKSIVMDELQSFFRQFVPIVLGVVIEMVVLDMQNKNGTLANKIKELENEKA